MLALSEGSVGALSPSYLLVVDLRTRLCLCRVFACWPWSLRQSYACWHVSLRHWCACWPASLRREPGLRKTWQMFCIVQAGYGNFSQLAEFHHEYLGALCS